MKLVLTIICAIMFSLPIYSQSDTRITLWPDKVPGESDPKHEAIQTDNISGDVIRLTDVSNPILEVFEPEDGKSNGAGIVLCPGGGYHILAIDLEGYEVAEWLNTLGYTVFVLQYRVPDKRAGALNDVQRAIRIVRAGAEKWKLEEDKIGVMGFSAGGSLSARASTLYEVKTYSPIDEIDEVSCKPDFSVLIYPAYLDEGENRSLTPELKVNNETPQMFLFATADDHYANSSLVMAGALRDAKVPVELHLLPDGGHGYGLRTGNPAAEVWPGLLKKWLATIIL